MKHEAAVLAILTAGILVCSNAAAQSPLAGPPAARAQSSDPFLALVGKKRERRSERAKRVKIERFVLASDDRAFLFEDRSNMALVKFLCGADDPRLDCTIDKDMPAAEIYQLTATRGPRGDVFYKDTNGETMLRIASYGGATVFWPGEDRGLAASKSFGDDAALHLDAVDNAAALRRAQSATAIVSAATGAPIIFDLLPSTRTESDNATVLADAVVRAAKGIKDVADDPTGARIIANRIRQVSFVSSAAPGVSLDAKTLEIRYVPDRGISGRPSSATVARFLEESL